MSDTTSVATSFDGPYNAEDQEDIDQIVTEAVDTASYAASIPDSDLPGEWSDGQKRDFRAMPSSQQNNYAGRNAAAQGPIHAPLRPRQKMVRPYVAIWGVAGTSGRAPVQRGRWLAERTPGTARRHARVYCHQLRG